MTQLLILALIAFAAGMIVTSALKKIFKLDQAVLHKEVQYIVHDQDHESSADVDRSSAWKSQLLALIDRLGSISPESQSSITDQQTVLRRSGIKMSTQRLWSIRIASLLAGIIVGMVTAPLVQDLVQSIAIFALFTAIGVILPQFYIWDKRNKWHDSIERELPDAIDMLCISVSAGSTFESSLKVTADRMSGVIGEEFKAVVREAEFTDIMHAMKRFATDADVAMLTNMVAAVSTAVNAGSPIVEPLVEQSKLAREMRQLSLETKAAKLDTKLIFPLGLLAMPSYLILVLAPFLSQLTRVFSH